jgi:hypothetical protein
MQKQAFSTQGFLNVFKLFTIAVLFFLLHVKTITLQLLMHSSAEAAIILNM